MYGRNFNTGRLKKGKNGLFDVKMILLYIFLVMG